jgi:hypothetical protein
VHEVTHSSVPELPAVPIITVVPPVEGTVPPVEAPPLLVAALPAAPPDAGMGPETLGLLEQEPLAIAAKIARIAPK